ncbi:MAG TPA: hypothetical protein VK504_26745, partial [Vicinamibacterales bacterium]|nr:hypothetical protein [Vicinamibacterales bacterium]
PRHAAHQQAPRGAMTAPAHCHQISPRSLSFVENSFDRGALDNNRFCARPSSRQRTARASDILFRALIER